MTDDTPADELPEPQPGALSGNVHPIRALAQTVDALRPDPATLAEERVLARLKPLHEMLVERCERYEQQFLDAERRLRALEEARRNDDGN